MAKDNKIVDARLRLPRTKTSSFELQLQLQRGTRGGEGGFPAVKRDMKTPGKVNQNWGCCFTVDSYQSLLTLLNFLKAYKKCLVFKNKNGFIVTVNLSFRASFLCVNIFSRGVNLSINKILENKTFWKTRLDVWLLGGRSCRWFTNLLSSWSTFKSRQKPWNSIACYNQIAPRY